MTEHLAADTSVPPVDTSTSEHSVPLFWPMVAAANLGHEALALMQRNLEYVAALDGRPSPSSSLGDTEPRTSGAGDHVPA